MSTCGRVAGGHTVLSVGARSAVDVGLRFPHCSAGRFWLRKTATHIHTLAYVSTKCLDCRYPNLKMYITEMISNGTNTVHAISIRNSALRDLNLSLAAWVQGVY
jgi:hypothetical protein